MRSGILSPRHPRMPVSVCEWSEMPRDECPHCTGDITPLLPHGNQARGSGDTMLSGVKMPAYRDGDFVVLGPCPGCQLWQLEYDRNIVGEFVQFAPAPYDQLGAAVDIRPFHDAVEGILQEHLEECVHLRRLLDLDW